MPRFDIDVDPCDHITADAIGKPGQRVFYLQAYQDQRTITVITMALVAATLLDM